MRISFTSGRAWFVEEQLLLKTRELYAHLRGNKSTRFHNPTGFIRAATMSTLCRRQRHHPEYKRTPLTDVHYDAYRQQIDALGNKPHADKQTRWA